MTAEPHYARLCKTCFVAAKKREQSDLANEVLALRAELQRLRTLPAPIAIDPDVVRWLLQRAHPDKNNGTEASLRATQWLNSLREAARA